MIYFINFYYTVCDYRCARSQIWGFLKVPDPEGDYYGFSRYIVWGSPKKPQIRKFYSNLRTNADMSRRLKEKRCSGKHIALRNSEIKDKYPELISEIGQYLMMKKLKNV